MTYPNAREMRYVEITNVSVRVATSETASRSVRRVVAERCAERMQDARITVEERNVNV